MIMRVKARMDAGEDVPDCLVKTLLLTQEQEKLDWEDLCMLSAVFTLGGVHSVRTNLTISVLSKSRLTWKLPFIDIGRYPLVPGSHLVTSRSPSTGPRRTRQGDWPGLLAECGRRATASVHSRHHQRGTLFSRREISAISTLERFSRPFVPFMSI
jgi:hypothetical protein